jgi:hypothetical protein
MGYEDGLGLGSGSAQLHNHNDGCCGRDGRHRVHNDAQLAVVRIGLVGVQVRNLGYGQNCQQDEAHGGYHRQKAGPTALSERL